MTVPVMQGPHTAKEALISYLASDIPTRLILYRNSWALDDRALPNPKKYAAYEVKSVSMYPTVFTIVDRTPRISREEIDSLTGDPVYSVRYDMRVIVWALGNLEEETEFIRDRLVTVIRSALLDHPALGEYAQEANCNVKVWEDTITEEFGETVATKGERFAAGGAVVFQLEQQEVVGRETVGILVEPIVTVSPISPTVPSAPSRVYAKPGDGEALVSWNAPAWDGGFHELLSGYTIESTDDYGTTWTTQVANTNSLTPLYTVTGLSNGTEYRFRVAAINDVGTSDWSNPSPSATPSA